MTKSLKTISVLASLALVLGMLVGAADVAGAKKKKKKKKAVSCQTFVPAEPQSNSEETAEALEAEVLKVTDKFTEDEPLVVEYEHGPALWETATQTPIHEDTVFFNAQVQSKAAATGLYARIEWSDPSPDDFDLYMYDASGAEVTNSGAFNAAPVGPLSDDGTGGMGFESISGWAANRCDGFTLESRAFMTEGEAMTLKLWLGEPAAE